MMNMVVLSLFRPGNTILAAAIALPVLFLPLQALADHKPAKHEKALRFLSANEPRLEAAISKVESEYGGRVLKAERTAEGVARKGDLDDKQDQLIYEIEVLREERQFEIRLRYSDGKLLSLTTELRYPGDEDENENEKKGNDEDND